MRLRGPACGVVSIAALDLRRAPDHRSELCSQLLLGETVRVLAERYDGRWCRVESLADRDRGWVRDWGLVRSSAARTARWSLRARCRVRALFAEVRSSLGGGALVSPLFWGARVIPGTLRGRKRQVELPDGRRGWTDETALGSRRARPPALEARVKSLLGIPYLWGGRTALGMDCSAFVQCVLAERGIALPRDAEEQYRECQPLDGTRPARPGDLVFFGAPGEPVGHVGVLLGGGYYAHSRGVVRINSMEAVNPLCDKTLMDQLRGVRRPLRRPPRARTGRGRSGV